MQSDSTNPSQKSAKSGRFSGLLYTEGKLDKPMLWILLLLLAFGSVMVFSASYAYALHRYGDSYYFIRQQIVFAVAGVVVMLAASLVDYRVIRKYAPIAYAFTLLCLAAVLIMGTAAGVAKRWLYIGGFGFQPTEIAKFTVVLILAWYISNHQAQITDYGDFKTSSLYGVLYPVLILGMALLLILLENHFSGLIIVFCIGMVIIFVGGARKIWLLASGGAALSGILVVLLFTNYAKTRIDVWLHPENYSLQGEVWQTLQGLYAVGNGGLLGVGLGNSSQKHLYVSAPQNDFIFSIVCEELGFAGAVAVITLFLLFIWRGFVIAMHAPDTFSQLVAIGIVSHVAIQAILNIMVVTAMIPNTGITLPFFSYGGSALLMLLGEVGILLGISRHMYRDRTT